VPMAPRVDRPPSVVAEDIDDFASSYPASPSLSRHDSPASSLTLGAAEVGAVLRGASIQPSPLSVSHSQAPEAIGFPDVSGAAAGAAAGAAEGAAEGAAIGVTAAVPFEGGASSMSGDAFGTPAEASAATFAPAAEPAAMGAAFGLPDGQGFGNAPAAPAMQTTSFGASFGEALPMPEAPQAEGFGGAFEASPVAPVAPATFDAPPQAEGFGAAFETSPAALAAPATFDTPAFGNAMLSSFDTPASAPAFSELPQGAAASFPAAPFDASFGSFGDGAATFSNWEATPTPADSASAALPPPTPSATSNQADPFDLT